VKYNLHFTQSRLLKRVDLVTHGCFVLTLQHYILDGKNNLIIGVFEQQEKSVEGNTLRDFRSSYLHDGPAQVEFCAICICIYI
jgi:hypothetical protein